MRIPNSSLVGKVVKCNFPFPFKQTEIKVARGGMQPNPLSWFQDFKVSSGMVILPFLFTPALGLVDFG